MNKIVNLFFCKYVSERGIFLVCKHIYMFYIPISTFRVSYKATTILAFLHVSICQYLVPGRDYISAIYIYIYIYIYTYIYMPRHAKRGTNSASRLREIKFCIPQQTFGTRILSITFLEFILCH